LMMTTKATTQMQRTQDNKQLLSSLVMTLSSKAADSDGDFVLEPPAYSTETITGFAAPTNGGFVGTDVANTDAWGRRLGYCAYDYGSATATPPSGTGLIRGSTASSPTDSWVAVVVISAGPDGVINSTCPAAGTVSSNVAAQGDDMVAARSYGEMISFGNAQIASTLSGLGTNTTNKLCRLGSDGKMVCDIATNLTDSNTPYRICRSNNSGVIVCDIPSWLPNVPGWGNTMPADRFCRTDIHGALHCYTSAATCGAGQVSKWNGSSFECVNAPKGDKGDAGPAGPAGGAGSLSSYAQYGGQTCGGGITGGDADGGVYVACPTGYVMTGGGYMMTAYNKDTNSPDSSGPCGNNCWHVRAGGVSGGCFNVWVICLRSQ
jgi:hypothetical protein